MDGCNQGMDFILVQFKYILYHGAVFLLDTIVPANIVSRGQLWESVRVAILSEFLVIIWKCNHSIPSIVGVYTGQVSLQSSVRFEIHWSSFGPLVAKNIKMAEIWVFLSWTHFHPPLGQKWLKMAEIGGFRHYL